ncbi:MAG: PKD domain-containing protein [Euryarchaeota archaeon]|nr:PKD domain-containing protein [Euryarchaeota archaeon]MDE2044319.1 PKD domain-containing protein [Thermoplasmata archaeon]
MQSSSAKALVVRPWLLVGCVAVLAGVLAVPAFAPPSFGAAGSVFPRHSAAPLLPAPPAGGSSPQGGAPGTAQNDPNGSPFLEVPSGNAWQTDDSILAEQYASPGATALVDAYLLQQPITVSANRVQLQVDQGAGYSTALDSVALESVAPAGSTALAEEGSLTVYSSTNFQSVPSAHDGTGANVTSLLQDPTANASTSSSTYLSETTGGSLLAAFGNVPNAAQDLVVLRSAVDPSYSAAGSPSGITVQVQDPSTGGFTTLGFIAPREYFSDLVLPIGSALGSGTEPVVLRLLWQGVHVLSWLSLASGVGTLPATQGQLLSAISSTGANWTQVLSSTNGQSAILPPDSSVDLTFAVTGAPAGVAWGFVTNGGAPPSGGGPTASFNFTPPAPVTGQAVSFTSTSTDPSAPLVSFTWNFGDGVSGSGANVSHVYAASGVYSVTLVVSDSSGYFAAATGNVSVSSPGGGGGGGGSDPVCGGAFACYLVNVTLAVGGNPGDWVNLTILSFSDHGRSSDHGGLLPTNVGPKDCDGRGGSGLSWVLSSDDPPCHAHPQFWLNVTRQNSGSSTVGTGVLVLPWNATRAPDLDDEFAKLTLHSTGAGHGTSFAVSFTTPFYSQSFGWTFRHHGCHDAVRFVRLGQSLGLVLAGGFLVTYDASVFPASANATSVSWSFSGPNPNGKRQHGCTYANLTCELLHIGVPLRHGFPRSVFDHATCQGLAGTAWDALVCGNATGGWTTHLFAWSGPYSVTVTILEPNGSTVTQVETADAQITNVNGP